MPIDFRQRSVTIPSTIGRGVINDFVVFNSNVLTANVAINGFKLEFEAPDRPFSFIEVDSDFDDIEGNAVNFRVEFQLADRNEDDPYFGYITVLVIAEVQS